MVTDAQLERLKDVIQDCNLNFLLGSGLSSPYLRTLGNIEVLLTHVEQSVLPESQKEIVRCSLYKLYFDDVMAKNLGILKSDSLQRYQLQTERIELIVNRLFPGSILRFGTQDKPLGIQYWVSDSTDHAVLCAFPGLTAVDEVEQMSDEQIEARIRECSTRKPLEN